MDGNYSGTMEVRFARADTVIFLDLPTWSCLFGAVRRYLRYRRQTRPDLAEGCTERLTYEYLKWICSYRKTRRPRIVRRLRQIESAKQVVILDSHAAVEAFLSNLSLKTGASKSVMASKKTVQKWIAMLPRPSDM
jgi:adenylate kinase family enzyme